MRQQDSRRAVGECLPADIFIVGHSQRPKRHVQLNDRYVGRAGDARHQRQFDVQASTESSARRQQLRRGEYLRVDRTRPGYVEQQCQEAVLIRRSRDRDRCALGDYLASEAKLGSRLPVAHDRVGWASIRSGGRQRRGRADVEAEAAEREAELRGIPHVDLRERRRDLTRRSPQTEAERNGGAPTYSVRRERSAQRGLYGTGLRTQAQQAQGGGKCTEDNTCGSTALDVHAVSM
jgi:hypothetical protein